MNPKGDDGLRVRQYRSVALAARTRSNEFERPLHDAGRRYDFARSADLVNLPGPPRTQRRGTSVAAAQAGKLRALAVTTATRSRSCPKLQR